MNLEQTTVSEDSGILIASCVGNLDEKTAPLLFGTIVKYAKEAPQVVIFDLTKVTALGSSFISGIVEITKYLQASGGGTIIVPGQMGDVLGITGIDKAVHTEAELGAAKGYAREHFPHVISYVIEKKEERAKAK